MSRRVQHAESDQEFVECFSAMQVLRPSYTLESFTDTVRKMKTEGFLLAYIKEEVTVLAIMGYRYLHTLYTGKQLYIDDLLTLPVARGRGLGSQLLDFAIEKAKENDCRAICLDTGYQRHDAHRLYLNKGFQMHCHHCILHLDIAM